MESKAAVENPNLPNKQSRLAQAAHGVSQSLNQVVSCLPGLKHVDQALKIIATASKQIDPNNSIFGKKPDQPYQTLQNDPYIDIILKKKQASEKYVHDADGEATMFEYNIAPQRSTLMQQIDQVTPMVTFRTYALVHFYLFF